MSKNKVDILQGVVVSIFGDRGPEAISFYPEKFDKISLSEISIKGVSILAGENGVLPPPNLSVIPLPKLQLTSVIYIFEIRDIKARGGGITATISVLFNEKYTSVIYKMIDNLAQIIIPMNKIGEQISNKELVQDSTKDLYNQINSFLNTQLENEVVQYRIVGQEEKRYARQYQFKVAVIGDPRVGKTTLLLRYVDKAFRELYIPTMGVQVSLKRLEFEDTLIQLYLWDIAGQELFNQVRKKFYTGSQGVIIMYDVTDPKTFKNVEVWYSDMGEILEKKPGFLIGNKIDLSRQISRIDGKELANKLDLEFFETSARTGENVDLVFEKLAQILLKK